MFFCNFSKKTLYAALLPIAVAQASPTPIDQVYALASRCTTDVHPATMVALIGTESGFNPFAIHVNNHSAVGFIQPTDKSSAVKIAYNLMKSNANFDAGYGQINISNIVRFRQNIAQIFDGCENIKLSALILKNCYAKALNQNSNQQNALRSALSCYNTGSLQKGFTTGYVQRVLKTATTQVPKIEITQPSPETMTAPIVRHVEEKEIHSDDQDSLKRKNKKSDSPNNDIFHNTDTDAFILFDHGIFYNPSSKADENREFYGSGLHNSSKKLNRDIPVKSDIKDYDKENDQK